MQRASTQPLEGNVVLRYRGQERDKVRSEARHWPLYPYYCPLPRVCLHPFLSHCQKKSKAKKNPTLAVLLGCEIFTKLLREESAWEKWLIVTPEPVLSRQTTAVTAITNSSFCNLCFFLLQLGKSLLCLFHKLIRHKLSCLGILQQLQKQLLSSFPQAVIFSAIMIYRQMET